ncbi:uncharacterized protein [Parasteatoda tepidariorum]|nr:uncharacterized protein LOC107457490 [Parasteatoda tepidariorum]
MFAKTLAWTLIVSLSIFGYEASLTIPSSMLSPLGVPEAMGPDSLTALKFAVGGRLLNMLGTGTVGQIPFISQGSSNLLPGLGGFGLGGLGALPLTPRSKEFSKRRGPNIPTTFNIRTATPTEIENFFAVLDKVDANKCISRLVCEVGSDPKVLEGLGHNIKDVMTSLRVLEKNALSRKYREIMIQGQRRGMSGCRKAYSTCDQKSYRLIKTFVKAFKVKN